MKILDYTKLFSRKKYKSKNRRKKGVAITQSDDNSRKSTVETVMFRIKSPQRYISYLDKDLNKETITAIVDDGQTCCHAYDSSELHHRYDKIELKYSVGTEVKTISIPMEQINKSVELKKLDAEL